MCARDLAVLPITPAAAADVLHVCLPWTLLAPRHSTGCRGTVGGTAEAEEEPEEPEEQEEKQKQKTKKKQEEEKALTSSAGSRMAERSRGAWHCSEGLPLVT